MLAGRRTAARARLVLVALPQLIPGCSPAFALDRTGPGALSIGPSAWWIASAILGCTLAALLLVLMPRMPRLGTKAARWMVIAGGLLLPGIALAAMLFARPVSPAAGPPGDIVIEIVARQFWWEIRYPNLVRGAAPVVTANELHIPAGADVRLRLTSADVIHGLAIPPLTSGAELVPGHVEEVVLRAAAPGRFRGACYAFCGLQHAHMALPVLALPQEDWRAWLRGQAAAAAPPDDALASRGQGLFVASGCASCHAVRGHGAAGVAGPDLTHFGSRETIGAGMLPNTLSSLTGWIAATQQIKPGAKMPSFNLLTGPELHALAHYLQALR
jgi:cytochrome c oxidase subunit 2